MTEPVMQQTARAVFGDEQAREAAAPVRAADRIASLDFIRGIAVMGILGANIIAFGQPFNAYISPSAFIGDVGDPGGWMWITQFVLVDGKMRGLFTLLFGAGMYLFMERAWERGSTRWLQVWRLALLFVFGLIHFFFIWIGDILIMYGLLGFVVVAVMHWSAATQMKVGLFGYLLGGLMFAAMMTPLHLVVETSFGDAASLAEMRADLEKGTQEALADDAETSALKQSGDYAGLLEKRVSEEWSLPFANSAFFAIETIPLMLIGMALYRIGFFSGAVDRGKMLRWGWIGVLGGGAVHLAIGLYVQSTGFAFYAATAAFMGWSFLPRLAMVLGLAALLVTYSQSWRGWLAERISAAGRAAFTNYLGTSVVMLFVFHGWALGLYGELNRPQLYLVVLFTWALMLAWSKPWLERYRYGPLEWLWRCLTYRTLFALKR
ncbi:MAG: DUF418 domain-containing protein [Pseudomonadota bacterium]